MNRREISRGVVFALTLGCLAACQGSHNRPLQLLSGAGPVYPAAAKAQGIEGEVRVRYEVDVNGTVRNAVVLDANPKALFDEAALAAVRSWRYAAPVINGQVTGVPEVVSVVRFRLNEVPEYLLNE